jgi:hypothetical protein
LSASAAQALPAGERAKLDSKPFHVVAGDALVEDAWETAYDVAAGLPVLVIGDSIQKLRARGAIGKGERERIEAVLEAIQECQLKWPATFVATSEIARGSGEAKGSVGIDYTATLQLALTRAGADVSVGITKNRDGAESPFKLVLDGDGQRLTEASAAKAKRTRATGAGEADVWAALRNAIAEHGPLSRKRLELWVKAGSERLRTVLAQRVELGDLIRERAAYRLP